MRNIRFFWHYYCTNGELSWFGAQAYVIYLNSISYGGSNQWRLPGWADTGAAGCQFGVSGTNCGFNVNIASGELAKLYYDELGKKAGYASDGSTQSNFGILGTNTYSEGWMVNSGDVGPFSNVVSYGYWYGTESAFNSDLTMHFFTDEGRQGEMSKFISSSFGFYAWAVSPGQVAAVPVPDPVWLMGSGIVGLLSLKRRGHAG